MTTGQVQVQVQDSLQSIVVPILSYLAAMLTYILGVTECMLCVHVVFPNPFMHAFSHHQCKVCRIEFASYTCTTPSYFMVE